MRKRFGEILGQRSGLTVPETDEALNWAHRFEVISRVPRLGHTEFTFDTAASVDTYDLDALYSAFANVPRLSLRSLRGNTLVIKAKDAPITLYTDPHQFWDLHTPSPNSTAQGRPTGALETQHVLLLRPVPDAIYTVTVYCVARPANLTEAGIEDEHRARLVVALAAEMRAVDLGRAEEQQRAAAEVERLCSSMYGDDKARPGNMPLGFGGDF